MTKTIEPSHAGAPSTKDKGRLVRQVRRTQGLSRAEVARSAGLTRRELAAYERGRVAIPDNDLWCLAGSCGVDVHEFIPERGSLEAGPSLASLAPGDIPRTSGEAAPHDGLLPGYRSMVAELRSVEAARLRGIILAPRTAPSSAPAGGTSGYRSLGALDPQSPPAPQEPVVDFFSAPRAEDPFSPQPSPVATPAAAPTFAAAPAPAPAPAPIAPGEVPAHAAAPPAGAPGMRWQSGGLFPASPEAGGGGLAHRHADVRWAFSDLVASGDVALEAVLEYRSGAGFGVLFRASSDENQHVAGYSFDLDAATNRYLVRQWADSRPHWRPIAEVPVTDPGRLLGHRTITLALQGDRLTASVDNETVLTVPALSQASIDLGREPCRGGGLGMHAGPTTVLTVEAFRAKHA